MCEGVRSHGTGRRLSADAQLTRPTVFLRWAGLRARVRALGFSGFCPHKYCCGGRTSSRIGPADWLFETVPWCPRDGPSARHFQKQFSMVPPQVLLRRANIVTDRASDWLFEIAVHSHGFGFRQTRQVVTHLRLIPPQVLLSRINIVTDRISDWRFESLSARPDEVFTDWAPPPQPEDLWESLAQANKRRRIRRGAPLLSPHFKVCLSCRPQLQDVPGMWTRYATCPHKVSPSSLPMMPADAPPLAKGKKLRTTHLALVRRGERQKKKKGLARCRHGLRERACHICNGCPHGKLKYRCSTCQKGCPHGKYVRHCKICSSCKHGKLRDTCKECRGSCEHGSLRLACRLCSGCPHGRLKYACSLCRPCPHGRLRINCPQVQELRPR